MPDRSTIGAIALAALFILGTPARAQDVSKNDASKNDTSQYDPSRYPDWSGPLGRCSRSICEWGALMAD